MADTYVQKSTVLDMYQFETYISGFLDVEYLNFDPKHLSLGSTEAEIISFRHAFLSIIEAEIISFMP